MLVNYGHASISWQGEKYTISPTFANIAKIGTPTEIIDDFKSFISTVNVWHKFNISLVVLNACSDKPIPSSLTGSMKFSERQQKFLYSTPAHGLPMLNDIIVLAEHCFLHGVCGKSNKKGNGDPIDSFDPYEFMELARVHLGLSVEESGNMTMTEFVRMTDAKFPPERNGEITVKETDDLIDWLENRDKAN